MEDEEVVEIPQTHEEVEETTIEEEEGVNDIPASGNEVIETEESEEVSAQPTSCATSVASDAGPLLEDNNNAPRAKHIGSGYIDFTRVHEKIPDSWKKAKLVNIIRAYRRVIVGLEFDVIEGEEAIEAFDTLSSQQTDKLQELSDQFEVEQTRVIKADIEATKYANRYTDHVRDRQKEQEEHTSIVNDLLQTNEMIKKQLVEGSGAENHEIKKAQQEAQDIRHELEGVKAT